uniref:Uncharacterized protein n=1 Tax=Meloidogyne hapla TaxID=6305 RepID=A0A1I8B651_MELHA
MYYLYLISCFSIVLLIVDKVLSSGGTNGGANAALEKDEIEEVKRILDEKPSPWLKPRFGSPILHISLIIPKAPDVKTGPELMFTLEISKRPSVAIKFFLTFIEGATIFISNKWLLREKRYACYTEYQFHGEHVRKHVIPKHLIENPNNDKEICRSSADSLPFNCNINFGNLRLGVEYKPPITPILKNTLNIFDEKLPYKGFKISQENGIHD